MCGICGIWLSPSGNRRVEPNVIENMTRSIAHRGPDAGSMHVGPRLGLGHRRLSIIDLENGAQPMESADGRCRLVYNGEIYNFPELRSELKAYGHRFRTRCDTEVIVEGFAHWGEDLFQRLSGMFAFALYDIHYDRLYLVRDRLGIKPLYFAWVGTDLVFASEIRSILASGRIKAAVEPSQLDAYVSLGYVPGERTLFRDVHKLSPAHFMVVDAEGYRQEQYWNLANVEPLEIGFDEAQNRFSEGFTRTLERHLISDVPLGVFLSGGVDSSAIVAFIREELGRHVATFSVGYRDDPGSSELEHAARVARRFGTDHQEFVLTHDDFFSGIDALLEHAEEPIVESAGVALMDLAKRASRQATVFLSGEGADEAFAGYDLYGRSLGLERLGRIVSPLGAHVLRAVMRPACRSERMTKYLDWLVSPLVDRYRSIPADVTHSIRELMYDGIEEGGLGPKFRALFDEVSHLDILAQMQYVDIKTWLVDDLLLKADKMTMAASIELRVPFLDHEMIEFGLALPMNVKRRNGVGKAFLKNLMRRYLPDDLLYRPKQGFPVPISKWLREDLYQPVRAILLDERCTSRGYFRRDYISECLERHRTGREDRSRRLFSLLVLELWHRKFIDGEAQAAA